MKETDSKKITLLNSTESYQYKGINEKRITEIDVVSYN